MRYKNCGGKVIMPLSIIAQLKVVEYVFAHIDNYMHNWIQYGTL